MTDAPKKLAPKRVPTKAAPNGVTAPTPPKQVARFQSTAADPVKAEAMAALALRPSVNAAAVLTEYSKPIGEPELAALVEAVSEGVERVNAGDLSRVEGMLFAQAQALQAMFMNFSRRALKQEYQKNLESFFRMGLKAQNQCRMTLETLANIKNPPVLIARQANINNGGQQQVNNGGGADAGGASKQYAPARTCAKQPAITQTELLPGHNLAVPEGENVRG